MNDVIVHGAIEAHSECEIDFNNGALTYLEQNSLSGYCQVSSRSPAMAFYDTHSSLRGFQRNCSNASLIIVGNLELT